MELYEKALTVACSIGLFVGGMLFQNHFGNKVEIPVALKPTQESTARRHVLRIDDEYIRATILFKNSDLAKQMEENGRKYTDHLRRVLSDFLSDMCLSDSSFRRSLELRDDYLEQKGVEIFGVPSRERNAYDSDNGPWQLGI